MVKGKSQPESGLARGRATSVGRAAAARAAGFLAVSTVVADTATLAAALGWAGSGG